MKTYSFQVSWLQRHRWDSPKPGFNPAETAWSCLQEWPREDQGEDQGAEEAEREGEEGGGEGEEEEGEGCKDRRLESRQEMRFFSPFGSFELAEEVVCSIRPSN